MFTSKKWGKKLLALSLALVMILSVVGCGGKKEEATESSTDTTTNTSTDTTKDTSNDTAADTAEKAPMVTIKLFRNLFEIGAPNTDEIKKVQDAINAYIGDKINVQVEITEIVNAEYPEKANLALASGEIDLLWTANWLQVVGCDDLVKQNAVYDLTDLLPKYEIGSILADWVWTASSYNNKNYFIPVYKDLSEGYNLMFRTDLVQKYGWDITKVKALKDIEPMLEQCKAEGIKYPYVAQRHPMFYRYYLNSFDFFSQDSFMAVDRNKDAVVNTVATPEYTEFATLMGDWADKGYLSEDDLTKATPETVCKTQDFGISWWTDVPNNEEADTRNAQSLEMAKVTDNWVGCNGTLGSTYCVSATCTEEEVDACLKFISLLYKDKTLADLYTYGIEGTDYNRVDGKVEMVKDALYNHNMWESTTPAALSLEVGEPDNKLDLYTAFNENAKTSIAAKFRFENTSVDAEYAACQQVFEEFGRTLELGGYAPADVPAAIADYQAALDGAGYQKVLAEAQKQYDEFKKTR